MANAGLDFRSDVDRNGSRLHVSGYSKLISPSWADGTALVHLLGSPLARPSPSAHFAASLPLPILNIAAGGALAMELLFAPLALFARLRPMLWTMTLIMQFLVILIFDFGMSL